MDQANSSLRGRAVVVTSAPAGGGGLGAATRDMADGLQALQFIVERVSASARPPVVARAVSSRPWRRYSRQLHTRIIRRDVKRRVPNDPADLLYAVPGLLSAGRCRMRVLHQAMHHPRTVRRSLLAAAPDPAARRWARRSLPEVEVRKLEAELVLADVIRVESEDVAADLLAHGVPAEKLVRARPGVDIGRFRPGPKPGKLVVAFVGTLELRKGVHLLAELSQVLENNAQLVMCGGPTDPWSRHVAGRIRGSFQNDVASVLAGAHALVLPSVEDGFGYVVLEAMAAGAVPFVTPEVGGAEVVRELDKRLVVPRPSFATSVPELLQTLSLRELGQAARAIGERHERMAMARAAALAICRRAGSQMADSGLS